MAIAESQTPAKVRTLIQVSICVFPRSGIKKTTKTLALHTLLGRYYGIHVPVNVELRCKRGCSILTSSYWKKREISNFSDAYSLIRVEYVVDDKICTFL